MQCNEVFLHDLKNSLYDIKNYAYARKDSMLKTKIERAIINLEDAQLLVEPQNEDIAVANKDRPRVQAFL